MIAASRYVVDASVGVKVALPEDGSETADALWLAAARGDVELLAPDIYVAEVTNVIWKHCRLRNNIMDDEARDAIVTVLSSLPELVPIDTLAQQALDLALVFNRPAYDCFYVALAIRDGITLVTADRALANSFGSATGRVVHLSSLEWT